jgi:hypothetical protein
MKSSNNRHGLSQDELNDQAKHSFSEGVLLTIEITNRLAEIARESNPIDKKTVSWVDSQLQKVLDLLYGETLSPMTFMGIDQADPLEAVLLDTFRATYSDGTPVWTFKRWPDGKAESAPDEFHSNDAHLRMTNLERARPPREHIVVADPPHRRRAGKSNHVRVAAERRAKDGK